MMARTSPAKCDDAASASLRILGMQTKRPRLPIQRLPCQRTNLARSHPNPIEPFAGIFQVSIAKVRQDGFKLGSFEETLPCVVFRKTRKHRHSSQRLVRNRQRKRAPQTFQLTIDGRLLCSVLLEATAELKAKAQAAIRDET